MVTVYLEFSQRLSLDFSNTGKVKIKNTFKAYWNSLNGMILMGFKGTVLFNGIGVLVFSLLYAFIEPKSIGNSYL